MFATRLFISLFLGVLYTFSYSQKIEWIENSFVKTKISGRYRTTFAPTENKGLYSIGFENKMTRFYFYLKDASYLEFYDSNFKKIARNEVKIKNDSKKSKVVDLFFNKNYYSIVSYIKSGENEIFYENKINQETHLPVSNGQMLFSTEKADSIIMKRSLDSSKILFLTRMIKNTNSRKFKIVVFNENLEIKFFEKYIEIPYENNQENFKIIAAKISNDGSVYIVGKLYHDRLRTSYDIKLLAYYNLGEESREYNVESGDYDLTNLSLEFREDGAIICIGTYADIQDKTNKGILFFTIDPESRRISKAKTYPLTHSILGEMGHRAKDTNIYPIDIQHILIQPDGGCIVIGEEVDYQRVSMGEKSYYITNRMGIVVTRFSNDGKITWIQGIPKNGSESTGAVGAIISYSIALFNNKIYLFFNGNINNVTFPNNQPTQNWSWTNHGFIMISIDENGIIKGDVINTYQESHRVVNPHQMVQLSASHLVFVGLHNYQTQLGELWLEK